MERGRFRPAAIAMPTTPRPLGPMGSNDPKLGPRRTARPPAEASGAFIYRKGRYTSLDAIPGAAPLAGLPDATVAQTHFAINDRGETAGYYADAMPGPDGMLPPGSIHGFIRQRSGRITSFDVPFPYLHDIADINDRGQVVGYYDKPTGGAGAFVRQPTGAITRIEVPRAYPAPGSLRRAGPSQSIPTASPTIPDRDERPGSRLGVVRCQRRAAADAVQWTHAGRHEQRSGWARWRPQGRGGPDGHSTRRQWRTDHP
jgi:hypothetical protein